MRIGQWLVLTWNFVANRPKMKKKMPEETFLSYNTNLAMISASWELF